MQPQRVVTHEQSPGSRIVWHVLGEGPALVLLHGGMGSWNHWIRNLEPLAAHYRTFAVDMPGYGDSDFPDGQDHPAGLATRLLAGLDELIGKNTPFRMAAFSFGGTVAAQMLRQAPSRILGLVLAGSSGLGVIRPGRVPMERWKGVDDPQALAAIHRRNLGRLMLWRQDQIDDEAVALHASNLVRGRVSSVEHSLGDSLRQVLAEVPVPLAGIWGEHDVTTPNGTGEVAAIFHALRGDAAPLITLEGVGHWVQYEAAERFNPLLIEQLARFDGGASAR